MEINTETLITIGIIYTAVTTITTWVAMIFWTYKDMKSRSRDSTAQVGVAIIVAILTIPGILVYLFLRPRETLAEAYERSLEEEALLQEIEEKPNCPGCGQTIKDNWQICPQCHTTLKKPCILCQKPLELSWEICPHCSTMQIQHNENNYTNIEPQNRGQQITLNKNSERRSRQSIEFIDEENY